MQRNIRIKSYLNMLQRDAVVECIKTLDEVVKLPSGVFFDGLMEVMQQMSDYDEILGQLSSRFNLPISAVEQLLVKLFELGVLEYYGDRIPEPLQRYHRQLLFFDSIHPVENFDDNLLRQQKLQDCHVMILGIGGIGNFIAMSLAAAGIGRLTLVDFDAVEISNLNRQILFDEASVGRNKVAVAAERLRTMNTRCDVRTVNIKVATQALLESLLTESEQVNYLVLSADDPNELVLWASALCARFQFHYVKCGYMAYQGLIGPLLGPNTRRYEELYQSWAEEINSQSTEIKRHNAKHIAPSLAAGNAILANIAALEIIKEITGVCPSVIREKRLLFNLKTMELYAE